MFPKIDFEPFNILDRRYNKLEKRIECAIRKYGDEATTEQIAEFLGKEINKVEPVLNDLFNFGKLLFKGGKWSLIDD